MFDTYFEMQKRQCDCNFCTSSLCFVISMLNKDEYLKLDFRKRLSWYMCKICAHQVRGIGCSGFFETFVSVQMLRFQMHAASHNYNNIADCIFEFIFFLEDADGSMDVIWMVSSV